MIASVAAIENQLSNCIENYYDDRCSLLELLRFLSKHPYTRFSRSAISLALRNQGVFVERGLKYLIEHQIVTVEVENALKLYSLTSSENVLNWAQELGKFDWHAWQMILKQIEPVDY